MAFTESQNRALAMIPRISGPLSVLGSGFILYEIIRDKSRWSRPYHRLLFSMCIFDALSSVALAMSTWPIPEGSPVYDASGTVQTCSAQAFFIQANIASPIYNFMLSLFFLLQVKHNVSEIRIRTRVEPLMQLVTILFGVGTAIVCLGLGLFNDSSLWCWINAAPKGCDQSYKHDDTTCTRGDNAEIFRWAFFFGPLWAAVIGTMITMFLLYLAVKKQERVAAMWEFPSVSTSSTNMDEVVNRGSVTRNRAGSSKARYRKSRTVALQALRYVAVFYITWVAGTINRLLQLILGRSYFWLMALHAFFTPLQGFLNFGVYVYPKYERWQAERRKRNVRASMMERMRQMSSRVSLSRALNDVSLVSNRHLNVRGSSVFSNSDEDLGDTNSNTPRAFPVIEEDDEHQYDTTRRDDNEDGEDWLHDAMDDTDRTVKTRVHQNDNPNDKQVRIEGVMTIYGDEVSV